MVRVNVHDLPVAEKTPELPRFAGHPGALQRLLQEDDARLQQLLEVCATVALLLQRPDAPLPFPGLAAIRREAERREVPVAILGHDARLRNQLLLRDGGSSALLGVSASDCPPLRLYWADFNSRPPCLNRFALVVLTADARALARRQERALELQAGLLTAASARPALLLLLRKGDDASTAAAIRVAKSLGIPRNCVFFEPGPGPAEAFLNAVHAFQQERQGRLFGEVRKWSRLFMTRQRNRLSEAQSRENEAGWGIDQLCSRTEQLESAFNVRRNHWLAGQWRRLDALLMGLLQHLRDERAVVWRLSEFGDDARVPQGGHADPQQLAREIAEFWGARLAEEVERWDAEGGGRIQAHLEASRAACLTEVFDAIPASQLPLTELEAVLEEAVFTPSPPAPAPADPLRLGCSLEAAFSQATWDLQTLAPRDSAATVERYRSNPSQALQRYLLYWRQYSLDLQLLRDFVLRLRPHLHPQTLASRLGGMRQRAVDLLSRQVGGELMHFRRLEDFTRGQREAFRSACHAISLVYLFEAHHMNHDSFRRDDFPRRPELPPTGPYCYHHALRLESLRGELASLKVRADPTGESNVLDLHTELKAWQQLSQEGFQGIAHLHGTVTLGRQLSFVFEACDGRLSDLLRADRSLVPGLQTAPAALLRALQQLCCFARQLFSATFFLHRRRFVHRDLATATIFYSHGAWTYELKLCNFTVSGTNTDIFDTMTYLSWYDTAMHGQRLNLTPALDMCNLGLVLWELYHGEPVAPRPMRSEPSLIPGLEDFDGPAPLRDLLLRCTRREEALRPTEADEPDILQTLRGREALGTLRRSEER